MLALLPLLLFLAAADCGHFLFWLPLSTKSVKIAVLEPGYALARKGHKITIVSPVRHKKEIAGVTEIIHESELEALQDVISDRQLVEKLEMPFLEMIEISVNNNRMALRTPQVKDLLKDDIKVDVVVTAPAFGNEAGYYIAHRKNASLVTFLPVPASGPHINWAIGDPFNPAYVPNVVLDFASHMSFKERCINTLVTIAISCTFSLYVRPKTEAMLREEFPGETVPSLGDLSLDTALHINVGSPFLGDGLRPVMPKTIMAGLMTCDPQAAAPLPKNLADFVEGAEHGVIFVSFGSVLKSSKMPEAKRQLLLSVFASLKQRIIWKWEVAMPDAPKNVLVSSWLPQQDLLAHPKVRLFISHGGAGSFQETICHKTPLVGIPINGDQHTNVAEAVRRGLGVHQDWHGLEAAGLKAAVEEVLENPAYREATAELSELVMDTPQHPLDRAVWWMEYLLRHPGNPGMRNPARHLSWVQYFLIDVIAFFVAVLVLICYILKKLVFFCCVRKQKKE